MKSIVEKDKLRRRHFFGIEKKYYLLLKAIIRDERFSIYTRYYFNKLLVNLLKGYYYSKIRNRCIVTGGARGIIKEFKLTRKQIVTFGFKGYLTGIKNSSW